MVESGTLPPVVQALMIQWTVLPRLLLDCGRVTSTQRLTIAAGCDVWAAVNAVWVDLELGVGAALAVAPPVTVCCAAGVVVLGWVLALADAEDLVVVELAVGICVAALPAAKVCLALPPPLPRPKVGRCGWAAVVPTTTSESPDAAVSRAPPVSRVTAVGRTCARRMKGPTSAVRCCCGTTYSVWSGLGTRFAWVVRYAVSLTQEALGGVLRPPAFLPSTAGCQDSTGT